MPYSLKVLNYSHALFERVLNKKFPRPAYAGTREYCWDLVRSRRLGSLFVYKCRFGRQHGNGYARLQCTEDMTSESLEGNSRSYAHAIPNDQANQRGYGITRSLYCQACSRRVPRAFKESLGTDLFSKR